MMFQILSLVVLAVASVNAEFKADCKDPCNCISNGVGLSWEGKFPYPLKFTGIDSGTTYDYVFSPCGAKVDCGNTSKPVVICQTDQTSNAHVVVGASSSVVWTFANESDTNHYTVTYGDGDMTLSNPVPRKGVVSVIVTTQGKATFVFTGENPMANELDYDFTANIPPGGGGAAAGGGVALGTVGIILIILLLGAVTAYFIIGAIVMFQVKGARGIEVVPNYTFWKDLPSLIKDGFLFTFQPCTGECSKKNTYESLS